MIDLFNKIVKELNLGNLISNPSRLHGGLTHRMYSVETDKGHYVVKLLNKEIMKRDSAFEKFSGSEELEKQLELNGIPCIYPIEFNNKKMQKIDDQYYYVFNYYDGHIYNPDEVTIDMCEKVGKIMAMIHNIDIKEGNCFLKKNEIDFEKLISLAKEKDSIIYDYLYNKLDILNKAITNCNEALSKIKKVSCICHNDLDYKNIMWKDDEFKIIDLECLCYSDPYKELLETALCWAGYEKGNLNYDLFKAFIKSYKENTKLDMNIDWEQVYYVNDGRLGWLEYNIKRALGIECVDDEEKELGILQVKETIKDVDYYESEKNNILNTINEIMRGEIKMNLLERNRENKEFFNEKANGYDEVHKPYMNTKNLLTESIDVEPNNIIDLGAGTGLELIEFFDKYPNSRVKAIDLSEEMLSKLKERSFASKVDVICGDFFSVDFGKDNDVIMSTSALHHFLYTEKARLYAKIYESLREGGIFINSDYTARSDEEEKQCIYNYEHKVNRHNDTPMTLEHEVELLKKVGFKDIEVKQPEVESYKLIKARK